MRDVRRRTGVVLLLSCPDIRSLASDSIDGDLPSSLILAFRDHLARCHPCRRLRIALVGALAPLHQAALTAGEDAGEPLNVDRVLGALTDEELVDLVGAVPLDLTPDTAVSPSAR